MNVATAPPAPPPATAHRIRRVAQSASRHSSRLERSIVSPRPLCSHPILTAVPWPPARRPSRSSERVKPRHPQTRPQGANWLDRIEKELQASPAGADELLGTMTETYREFSCRRATVCERLRVVTGRVPSHLGCKLAMFLAEVFPGPANMKRLLTAITLLAMLPVAEIPGQHARSYAEGRNYTKWEKEVAAYEAADRQNPPPKDGIVFIGSSTIRLWKTLSDDFPHTR